MNLINRRSFIKISVLSSGALSIGVGYESEAGTEWQPNLYVRINTDNKITIVSKNPECGQGVKTAFPMVVAECLDVPWEEVTVEQAPLDKRYGRQAAGGSRGTADGWDDLRTAGAAANYTLRQAAASLWDVSMDRCRTSAGFVSDSKTGKKASFSSLIKIAAELPAPDISKLHLKERPEEFNLLGKRITGVDNQKIFTGQALFASDVRLPDMVYAVYEKCPSFGGKVKSANIEEIKKLPGVTDAFVVEGTNNLRGLAPGVAIVGRTWWEANSARKKLKVKWDAIQSDSSDDYQQQAEKLLNTKGQQLRNDGNVDKAFTQASKVIESTYYYPFVAHANMEPQNCTAFYDENKKSIEFWAPTQNAARGQSLVANLLGIPQKNVHVNQMRIGGGFGRRLFNDFMAEAAWIAAKVKRPVQLQWTREDDIAHDHYRPGAWHKFKAGIDNKGRMIAFDHHFVTFGKNGKPVVGAGLSPKHYPAGLVPNFRLSQSMIDCNVPTGPWRSPGHSIYCWAYQSFFDEVAAAGGRDALDFRLELLAKGKTPLDLPRLRGVLKLAAEKAGWGQRKLPKGHGLGLGFHYDHGGYTAHAAEVKANKNGEVKVIKVYSASDVGPIINLSGAENQVQGSVIDALSTATLEMTFKNGAAEQSNFHDYSLLRLNQSPEVEAFFIQSDNPPTGLGEPPIAAVAPAITNAIFNASGKRVKNLPLIKDGISV